MLGKEYNSPEITFNKTENRFCSPGLLIIIIVIPLVLQMRDYSVFKKKN